MGVIGSFTGFNVADSFTPTPSDANKIAVDPGNVHARVYVWVIPLTTGTLAGQDLNGNNYPSITFATKDLNVMFPLPYTQIKSTGTTATLICVFPK